MNMNYKTLKEWILFFEEKGFKGLVVKEETSFMSLTLSNDTLPKLYPRTRKSVLLKEQVLTISFERESGLLGIIRLQLVLKQRGKEVICAIKPIGGKQLDLFYHNYQAEEGVSRFVKEYNTYFNPKNFHTLAKAS